MRLIRHSLNLILWAVVFVATLVSLNALDLTQTPTTAPDAEAKEAVADPAKPLAELVGKLAALDVLKPSDYAEFARTTITYAETLQDAHQPVSEKPIHDALAGVAAGKSLDAKAADWESLRIRLEQFLEKPPKQDDQQQDQQKQDQQKDQKDKNQQNQDQKDQQDSQNQSGQSGDKSDQQQGGQQDKQDQKKDPSDQGKSSQDSGQQDQQKQDQQKGDGQQGQDQKDQQQKDQQSGQQDQQGRDNKDQQDDQSQKDDKNQSGNNQEQPQPSQQSAFGDMKKDGEKTPEENKDAGQSPQQAQATQPDDMQQVGGASDRKQEAIPQQLVVPLQRLDTVRGRDSPAVLFQRMEAANKDQQAEPPKTKGKDW